MLIASLTVLNSSVVNSVAGATGGGVSLAGATSSGAFFSTTFTLCNASMYGGALAAANDVRQLLIEDGAFSRCHVEEQGGAVWVAGPRRGGGGWGG